MPAVDAGAEDIVLDEDVFEVLSEPSDLAAVRAALVEAGIEVQEAQVMQRPKTLVPLDEDGATKLMKLIDTLEDLDDTDAVHANFDVDAEVLERVAGSHRHPQIRTIVAAADAPLAPPGDRSCAPAHCGSPCGPRRRRRPPAIARICVHRY